MMHGVVFALYLTRGEAIHVTETVLSSSVCFDWTPVITHIRAAGYISILPMINLMHHLPCVIYAWYNNFPTTPYASLYIST